MTIYLLTVPYLITMSDIADETSLHFSYSPKELLASYERLIDKESELLSRCASFQMPALSTRSSSATMMDANNSSTAIVVAATQITGAGLPPSDVAGFCFRAEQAIEQAVRQGASLILLPELWAGPYFCQSQEAMLMGLASDIEQSLLMKRMQQLARLYNVVLPISFYERKNQALYNSIAVIDSDGSIAGTYRKSHIPDGTGYQEKFYFSPGDTGFKVFETKLCKIGVAICWDQWFPECARAMVLQGADILLYPTAIGSEPQDPTIISADHWQRTMQGHSAANMIPVVCSNRFGTEVLCHEDGTEKQRITFYGRSFITDNTGEIMTECSSNYEQDDEDGHKRMMPVTVVTAEIDILSNLKERLAWGLFRDRRPDLYGVLLTKDGTTR